MKTKITLLGAVLASILFLGGCASTESTEAKTFLKADLHLKNGVFDLSKHEFDHNMS